MARTLPVRQNLIQTEARETSEREILPLSQFRGCQVMNDAPFQWATIFSKDAIRFDNRTSGLSFHAAQERNTKYQTPTPKGVVCDVSNPDHGRTSRYMSFVLAAYLFLPLIR